MKIYTSDSKQWAFQKFAEFARFNNVSISDAASLDAFIERIAANLKEYRDNPIAVHGFRVQTMFAYVVAALGRCRIITEEDTGTIYSSISAIKRPDFRLVTTHGLEFLVEVKNFNPSNPIKSYSLKRDYAESLNRYAENFHKELLIAIYWRPWRTWTLTPLRSFCQDASSCSISLCDAIKENHFGYLGDHMIGIPKPFSLRFFTDPTKPRHVEADGTAQFTIGRVAFVASGKEVVNEYEQRLAHFFLRYGAWDEIEHPAEIQNGELISFDLEPIRKDSNPKEFFLSIGWLSSMIARQFDSMTAEEGSVLRLSPNVTPDKLGISISSDFTGDILRIWRFRQKPTNSIFPSTKIVD